jgi:hypothetical protein
MHELPVLKAVAFQEFDLGGRSSSRPCIVSVTDENDNFLNDSYVIKIYEEHRLNHTCKEVYAAILAQHFALNIPEPVLIELDITMINELRKQEKYKGWRVSEGVYFGSKYFDDAKSFTDTLILKPDDYKKIGNIFAFDVLIINLDRQHQNPNIIIKNKNIYIIDHELSMIISKPFDEYLKLNHWDRIIKEIKGGHLFRQHFWQMSKKNKVTFDEFRENLRTLNPKILFNYAQQLAEYQYEPLDIGNIVSYLAEVQKNESKFLALLDHLIH